MGRMVKKHIEVDEDLHDLISFYCFVNKIKIKTFVGDVLKRELEEFSKKREILKRLRK